MSARYARSLPLSPGLSVLPRCLLVTFAASFAFLCHCYATMRACLAFAFIGHPSHAEAPRFQPYAVDDAKRRNAVIFSVSREDASTMLPPSRTRPEVVAAAVVAKRYSILVGDVYRHAARRVQR